MYVHDKIYIDGGWAASTGNATLTIIDSTNGQVIGSTPEGTREDVDRAAQAAATAFPTWAERSAAERAAVCLQIADGLEERSDEIASIITRESGMPKRMSIAIQAGLPVNSFRSAANVLERFAFESTVGNSLVLREPIGVVGALTPWNYPLHQIAAKVAYAMAAGCSIVLKPSEIAPLDAYILAEVMHAVRVPDGVFNLVPGLGAVVGDAIARHPLIDMVSFTGSTGAGKTVAAAAAETVKRVALELGGKSANLLLDDLDDETFERAVRDGIAKCFLNSGQTCTSLSRMLVPANRVGDAERLAAAEVDAKWQPTDPFAERGRLGPLSSAAQVSRVLSFIESGINDGAKLVTGGAEKPEGEELQGGFYVRPTVFSDVRSDMVIAQEEIFGPVLSIMPYNSEAEAIRIANDSPFGLSGAVWSADPERAKAVARKIRTGQVEINGGQFNPNAPFGGYKQSGNGREYGTHGFEEFLEVKSLQL
jgi:acyl-CoA reductase-like NAD-dependent aldehyde dehydrogenase